MEIAIIPQYIINKLFSDHSKQVHANILMTSILIITILLFWQNHHSYLSAIPHFCVFQKVLKIPCPGCGVTRSLLAITTGNILSAWKFNPAGIFLFLFLVAQVPMRIIALKSRSLRRNISLISWHGSRIVIFVLFLVWIARVIK